MTALPIAYPAADREERFPELDGLRGIAILLVMLLHFTMQLHDAVSVPAKIVKAVFGFGWSGVDLFFVLSGFLITGILYDAKGSANYFRTFYARRALRILPLYYGALTLLFVAPRMLPLARAGKFIVPLREQIWYWLYLQNFHPLPELFIGVAGHFWSLAIEEQFYLVWPIVILLFSRKKALIACGLAVFGSLLYRIFVVPWPVEAGAYNITFAHLDGVAMGSALALLLRGPKRFPTYRRTARYLAATALGVSFVLYPLLSGQLKGITNLPVRFIVSIRLTLICLGFAGTLYLAVATDKGKVASFLRQKWLRVFGKYSYGLYVIHVPLIPILALGGILPAHFGQLMGSDIIGLLSYIGLMTAVSIVLAWISWNAYEKQFLRLKSRFSYRK